MNYIAQLKAQLADQSAQLTELDQELRRFYEFLHCDKFTGTETDGSRKDWIASGDVINWVRETRSRIHPLL